MRVQTKITLLLALVVTAVVGGVLAFRTYDRFKFQRIARERLAERNQSFDEFLQRNGEAVQTLVEDSTCLDRLVQALSNGDNEWCEQNLNDATLSGYHANAIWIYRPDGTLFYHHNNLNSSDLGSLPISREDLPRIFADEPLRHFFVQLAPGIMEIRAGSIHPSKDFHRTSRSRGYLFAGRLWNKPTLAEMSIFTGNQISIAPLEAKPGRTGDDQNGSSISFDRVLESWAGKRVARLVIRNE